MIEPAANLSPGAIAAMVSTVTMAFLGVDHYSLLWGLVGALLALYQAEKMGRTRALIYVMLSTLVGAAVGNGAIASISSTSKPLLIVASLVSGFGAQLVVTALLRAGLKRIDRLGGE